MVGRRGSDAFAAVTRAALELSEGEFAAQVCEAAELLGWQWLHIRPGRTAHGWRSPISGPLGHGWPDLLLTRERDGRVVLAELKSNAGVVSPEQIRTLEYLRSVARRRPGTITVAVWRPIDFDAIVEILT